MIYHSITSKCLISALFLFVCGLCVFPKTFPWLVRCLGTEDRVNDFSRKVLPNPNSMPFVSFPGSDIKDLFVHDNYEENSSDATVPNAATAFGNSSQAMAPAATDRAFRR